MKSIRLMVPQLPACASLIYHAVAAGKCVRRPFPRAAVRRGMALCVFSLMVGGPLLAADKPNPPAKAAPEPEVLLFSFFRDNGQAGIYLAASADGLRFTPLNNDQPVMKPAQWARQRLTRDPSMVFHEGKFRAVWTSSWKGTCFGYAESTDLVHWSTPLRVEPFPASRAQREQPANVWAPEICWDPIQKNFLICWASAVPPVSGKRLYMTRTTDGQTFSPATLFLDPHFSCIDGMMVFDETAPAARWVMIYKNEEAQTNSGKNLLVATAPADFSKPWSLDAKPIIGPGTNVRPESMVEGPSLLKTKSGWSLYWDSPLKRVYAVASSPDLKTWTDHTAELQLPPHPRHGTFFRAPRSAIGWLNQPSLSNRRLGTDLKTE